jgi:hypothetical protein
MDDSPSRLLSYNESPDHGPTFCEKVPSIHQLSGLFTQALEDAELSLDDGAFGKSHFAANFGGGRFVNGETDEGPPGSARPALRGKGEMVGWRGGIRLG